MDENFEWFLSKFTPMPNAATFPDSSLRKYSGRVPNQLLGYWRRMGLCGFNSGSFWFTNPDDYTDLMAVLLEGKSTFRPEECFVFARSAFGHLHVWCERIGTFYLSVPELRLNFGPPNALMRAGKQELQVGAHLTGRKPFDDPSIDVLDDNGNFLLKPAQTKLGPLAVDECYGFFPALPLGGSKKLDLLEKVKVHAHLMMVAQMDSLRIFDVSQFPPRQIE